MANQKLYITDQETGEAYPIKLVDPGDGSGYSISTTAVGGSGGDATAANQVTGNASLASIDAGIPAALGPTTAANSMPVTLANDGVFVTNFGAQADAAASSDTGTFSLIALIKRLLTKLMDGVQALSVSLSINDTSATLYVGTASLTGTAAAIASSQSVREVIVQNDPDSTVDILIGNSTAQTFQLKPNTALSIPVSDLATVFAKTVSGTATLNYIGRS